MRHLLAFLLICTAITTQAQITGIVTTTTKELLPGAIVLLLYMPDSAVKATALADDKANYMFDDAGKGTYLIKVLMAGYTTSFSTVFNYTGDKLSIPPVSLKESSTKLNELTVKANASLLEMKSDRMIVRVDKMNTTGDNALEVLKRAPGVRLDKDDNILFRGNGIVLVVLNGKQTYMSSSEISAYLKTMPASAISKIELMANPPASYDASGTAGVINIVMKRNTKAGFNGNATVGTAYGRYGKASASTNLNYNTPRFSHYARLSYGYSESYNHLTLGRQIGDELYRQQNYWHPFFYTGNYTIGTDYTFNAKNTIGIMLRGYNEVQDALRTSTSDIESANGTTHKGTNGINTQHNTHNTYSINLNYSSNIDSTGRKLSFDADYVSNKLADEQGYENTFFNAMGNVSSTIYMRSINPVAYSVAALKGDYVHPFARKWLAEMGFKVSGVGTDNNAVFDSLKGDSWVNDPRRSNQFNYLEHIFAAYLSLSGTLDKHWELKASLRAEQTLSFANSITLQQLTDRSYGQFFSGLFLAYHANDDHHINASYSRRIQRQDYTSLNPFVKYSDPYTAFAGNPYLQPSLSGSYLLGYSYKNFEFISLSYLRVNDAITWVIYQNDENKESINRTENLGTAHNWSASSSGSFKPLKWWEVTLEAMGAYDVIHTQVQGGTYHNSMLAWSGSTQQAFSLPHSIKLQVSAQYYSASVTGLERALPVSQVDAGISKTFGKDRATLSFKARDIFFGNRYRSILRYANINTSWNNEYESRRFSLSFTYKFGSTAAKKARERDTGTTMEEERM